MLKTRNFLILVALGLGPVGHGGDGIAQTAPTSGGATFGRNVRISGNDPNSQSQNETAIAVNPTDPANLVAVFQGRFDAAGPTRCFFAYSMNGGNSWKFGGQAPLQKSVDNCFDPSVAADAQGNFYFSYDDINFTAPPFGEFDIVVAKSVDGGKTFPTFSVAVNNVPGDSSSPTADKGFIAVDTGASSPFLGSIYLGFTNLTSGGENIEVAVSGDGGATWAAPVAVAVAARNERVPIDRFGALPVIALDGTLYIFYSEFPEMSMGQLSIRYSKSTDGGVTWSSPDNVAAGLPSPGFFVLKNADPEFGISPFHGVGGITIPTAAVAPDGTLYAAWVDFPNGSCTFLSANSSPACTDADVRLAASRNGGATWSAPVKVSDDTGTSDQFLPWIATHPDGRLSVVWQDRRLDPNNINYDAFYTNTLDGMAFLPNVRISSATSTLGTIGFVGDYNGLAASGTTVLPVWCDTRAGNPDIFFAGGKLQ